MGNVQISAMNEPYLITALPLTEGVIVASRLSMNVLWDVVKDIRFGEKGQAYVVTDTGQLIAHTDPKFVLANTDLRDQPQLLASLQASGQEWSGSYRSFQGVNVVAATAPVPGTSWVVVTEVPLREAFASSRIAFPQVWLGTTLFGILAIYLAGLFLRRMVTGPIGELQTGAKRIGRGDWDYRIEVIREDEVGQLAAAFNVMAGELQESYRDLETQGCPAHPGPDALQRGTCPVRLRSLARSARATPHGDHIPTALTATLPGSP